MTVEKEKCLWVASTLTAKSKCSDSDLEMINLEGVLGWTDVLLSEHLVISI